MWSPFIWRFHDGLNTMHDWPGKAPGNPNPAPMYPLDCFDGRRRGAFGRSWKQRGHAVSEPKAKTVTCSFGEGHKALYDLGHLESSPDRPSKQSPIPGPAPGPSNLLHLPRLATVAQKCFLMLCPR